MRIRNRQAILALPLALVLAAATFLLFQQLTITSADQTAVMSLNVIEPAGSCDDPLNPTTCNVPLGSAFTLAVSVKTLLPNYDPALSEDGIVVDDDPNTPNIIETSCNDEIDNGGDTVADFYDPDCIDPAGKAGYIGIQTKIDYGALVYEPAAVADEIVWPDSALPLRSDPESPSCLEADGLVCHGDATGIFPPFPVSTHIGNIVEITLNCTDSDSVHTINLVPLDASNTNGTGLMHEAPGQVPASDSLEVVCGNPPATDTPTPTTTPTPCLTPGKVPANGGCGTPTDTPTATPTGPTSTPTATPVRPLMSLDIDGPGLAEPCRASATYDFQEECEAVVRGADDGAGLFTITVNADRVPAGGYGGFETQVSLGGLTYDGGPCQDEVVWGDLLLCEPDLAVPAPPSTTLRTVGGLAGFSSPFLHPSDDLGALVELDVRCPAEGGRFEVVLVGQTLSGTTSTSQSHYIHPEDLTTARLPLPVEVATVAEQRMILGDATASASVRLADVAIINCRPPTAFDTPIGPSMSLDAQGQIDCNDDEDTDFDLKPTPPPEPTPSPTSAPPSTPTKCTAEEGAEFTITVNANTIPDGGYGGFGTEVWLGGLTPTVRDLCDEVVWPESFACSTFDGSEGDGHRRAISSSGIFPPLPKSNVVGKLVELDVSCPEPGQFMVVLTAGAGIDGTAAFGTGAYYVGLDGVRMKAATAGTLHLDLDSTAGPDTAGTDAADALLINCVAPSEVPSPSPTITPTPCPAGEVPFDGGCAIPTITPTPEDTATPMDTATPITPGATSTVLPTVIPLLGDVNCDGLADSLDALLLLQFAAGITSELPCAAAADADGNSVISALDALAILQHDAGLLDVLGSTVGAGRPAGQRVDRLSVPEAARGEELTRLRAAGSDGGPSSLAPVLASLALLAAMAMGAGLYRWWRQAR